MQGAAITDPIKNTIGILAGEQNSFFPKNRQVLGNIALRRANAINDVLNAGFLITQHTENLQAQRMRNGFQGTSRQFDVLLLFNEIEKW